MERVRPAGHSALRFQPYLPTKTVLAALDASASAPPEPIFSRSFSDKVFVISFFSNVITAHTVGLPRQPAWRRFTSCRSAVIVVLGIRIFTNVSSIRRFIFKG
ncbi:MAG: DUF1290 domain-containing protein [Bifidobacterium pseudocatenulatum]